jgi:hypothetical protein
MSKAIFSYQSAATGKVEQGELNLEDYRTAQKLNMTVSGFINSKYSDADPKFGSAFHQGQKSLGIHVAAEPERGILPSMIGDILDGTVTQRLAGDQLAAGGIIVAPSTQGTTPASRVFFPETVLATMNAALLEDYNPELQIWSRMISNREFIATEMFTQPLIDVTAPRSETASRSAQNTLPKQLISITTSQSSKSVATDSIGLQISEQAQARSTIDLVVTILTQQAEGARFAQLWSDISNVVTGNADVGQSAISATGFKSTYDSTAGATEVTQKGWLKMLYDPTRKVSYDSIITTLDTFLAIQNRSGRPLVYDPTTSGPNAGALGVYGLDVNPNLLNWSVGVPNVMLVPDGTIAANQMLVFDSRFFLREVINTSAAYSATEKMVLQRSDFFRFDTGRMMYRLLEEAGKLVDITNA